MVGEVKLRMTGGPELERALRELGGKIAGRLGANAVRAGGRELVRQARQTSEFVDRTGELRRSIRVFSRTRRRGQTIESDIGTDVFYARFLEFGTAHIPARSWFRKAIDESGQAMVDKVVDNLGRGIERETAKYKARR